jgi:hypothetical protein
MVPLAAVVAAKYRFAVDLMARLLLLLCLHRGSSLPGAGWAGIAPRRLQLPVATRHRTVSVAFEKGGLTRQARGGI